MSTGQNTPRFRRRKADGYSTTVSPINSTTASPINKNISGDSVSELPRCSSKPFRRKRSRLEWESDIDDASSISSAPSPIKKMKSEGLDTNYDHDILMTDHAKDIEMTDLITDFLESDQSNGLQHDTDSMVAMVTNQMGQCERRKVELLAKRIHEEHTNKEGGIIGIPMNSPKPPMAERLKRVQSNVNVDMGSLHSENTEDSNPQSIIDLQILKELIPRMDTVDTQRELYQQSGAEWCNDIGSCPCIQRIRAILKICELYQDDIGIGEDIDGLFEMENYSITNLENDFQHIHQIHTTNLDDIVLGMRRKVKCTRNDCEAAARVRVSSGAISSESTRRGLMDKIHSFFLQFRFHFYSPFLTILFGVTPIFCDNHCLPISSWIIPKESSMNTVSTTTHSVSEEQTDVPTETSYDDREDKRWINTVQHLDPNDKSDQLPLYEKLVGEVGIYRWQGTTGFTDQRVLCHLKPKFKNIKEFSKLNDMICVVSINGFVVRLHLLLF